MSLVDAIRYLGLQAEVLMNGRWARLEGERCPVYVVEMSHHRGFFTWCDHPDERHIECFSDPLEAILSGLERAAKPDHNITDDEQ